MFSICRQRRQLDSHQWRTELPASLSDLVARGELDQGISCLSVQYTASVVLCTLLHCVRLSVQAVESRAMPWFCILLLYLAS
jgi:hypothetical protein